MRYTEYMSAETSQYEIKEVDKNEYTAPHITEGFIPLTQAPFYGDWQESAGRKVWRMVVRKYGGIVACAQVVVYPLVRGKTYLYIPYGPLCGEISDELVTLFAQELRRIARVEHAVFARIDPTPTIAGALLKKHFTRAPQCTYRSSYFQPRNEWALDVRPSPEAIFSAMHKNTRYAIRTAEQRDIVVEIVTENASAYFNVFYALMEETAQRNGFSLHPKAYYQYIFEHLREANGYLAIARYKDEILVVDVIVTFAGVAHYLFSGSSTKERNRTPSYLATWRAILHAREQGCETYNFGGVDAAGEAHVSWGGITKFKERFGGRRYTHASFYDAVYAPFWYYAYVLRKWLMHRGV